MIVFEIPVRSHHSREPVIFIQVFLKHKGNISLLVFYVNLADRSTVARIFPSASLHDGFSSCSSSRPCSRFKEEPYEHPSLGHGRPESRLHTPAQSGLEARKLQLLRDSKDQAERGEMGGPCPLLAGGMLGKGACEQPRTSQGLGQHLPMQMLLEQRRRLRSAEAPFEPQTGHLGHCNNNGERRTARGEERKVLMGMGLQAQSPYVSLNFHHVLAKHGSFPAAPYSLSHLTDGYGYRGEELHPYLYRGQSPASSPSPETPNEMPHYIGTSVIISNER